MSEPDHSEILRPRDRAEWRAWLERHHAEERTVWVAIAKKGSTRPGVTYDEAVEEALAFGWIDGQARSLDEDAYIQRMSPRRPKSGWAPSNRARVARLTAEGRMAPAGLAAVEEAKADGWWDASD